MYRQLIEEEITIRYNQFYEKSYCQNSLQIQLILPTFTTTDIIQLLQRGVSLPFGIAQYQSQVRSRGTIKQTINL